jgi:hypothetical protein
MSGSLVADESSDLTGVQSYQARKLLICQRDGNTDVATKNTSALMRAEIGELLRDPSGPEKWSKLALGIAAPHQQPSALATTGPNNVFDYWAGAAMLTAPGNKGFREDLCAAAVEVIERNPGKYTAGQHNWEHNYTAVAELLGANQDFQNDMRIALGSRRVKSYLGLVHYSGIRSLASVSEKDVLRIIEAIAQDCGTRSDEPGYGPVIDSINAVKDPRSFVDQVQKKATSLQINLTIEDALKIAYVLYYKRYEYVSAALDLRKRAAAILGTTPQYTLEEAAMVVAGLTLHDRHCLVYGRDLMERYVSIARGLGFTLGEKVYFSDNGQRKDGILVALRPSKSSSKIVAMVNCPDKLLEPYLVQLSISAPEGK